MKQKVTPEVEPWAIVAPRRSASSDESVPPDQIQPSVNHVYKVAGAYWACKDESTLERVDQLLIDNDIHGLNALKEAGDVILLKPGQTVQWLGSSGYLGSRVRLRLVDSRMEFWTSREALR